MDLWQFVKDMLGDQGAVDMAKRTIAVIAVGVGVRWVLRQIIYTMIKITTGKEASNAMRQRVRVFTRRLTAPIQLASSFGIAWTYRWAILPGTIYTAEGARLSTNVIKYMEFERVTLEALWYGFGGIAVIWFLILVGRIISKKYGIKIDV